MGLILNTSTIIRNLSIGPLSGGGGGGAEPTDFTFTNLLGHYDMGNSSSWGGSGTQVNDLSGLSRHATFQYSPSIGGSGTGTHVTGVTLETDFYSNRMGISEGVPLTMTYSHWFRINGNTSLADFAETARTSGGTKLARFTNNYSNGSIRVSSMGTDYEISNFHSTHGTNWVNVALVANAGSFSVYLNGSLDGTFTDTDNVASTSEGITLYMTSTGIHWAQTAMYSVALSSSQVLGNFNALKSRYGY
jgi:acylphosphatase